MSDSGAKPTTQELDARLTAVEASVEQMNHRIELLHDRQRDSETERSRSGGENRRWGERHSRGTERSDSSQRYTMTDFRIDTLWLLLFGTVVFTLITVAVELAL